MRRALWLAALLGVVTPAELACSGSKSSESGGTGALPAGGGGTAGATASGGMAGVTASGGAAGLDASSDGPVHGNCELAAPPAMVQLVALDGTPLCIDATEVTQADYAAFLASSPGPPGSEHANCAALNDSYDPWVDNSPCSDGGAPGCTHDCNDTTFTPSTTPNRPVVCLDWCDAFAYCKWAGKRLCGRVGGGAATYEDPLDDASRSQWYAACSQNGARVYPYGNAYQPETCEGLDVTLATDAGSSGKKDVGALPCHGSGPYAAVVDMSGGAAEFEDACSKGVTGDWSCRLRGGSFDSPAADLACASAAGTGLYAKNAETGFRCCKN